MSECIGFRNVCLFADNGKNKIQMQKATGWRPCWNFAGGTPALLVGLPESGRIRVNQTKSDPQSNLKKGAKDEDDDEDEEEDYPDTKNYETKSEPDVPT